MGKDFVIIMVTCSSRSEARKIAGSILKKRLAACVNIMNGVESRFWWKNKIERANETFLMTKTVRANFKKIENEIKRVHSYEVPEIIALPIITGSKDYLDWIEDSTR